MHKEMPQLGMAGVRGGDNGATGCGQVPIHAALGSPGQAVFGLGLCAHRLRGGPNQPTDHGFGNFSLTDLRWIEHAEVHQGIGHGSADPKGHHHHAFQFVNRSHNITSSKNHWAQSHSNQVEGDAGLHKEAQTQRIVGVSRIVFATECDS